jgi:uncharacterized protein YkwD
MIGDAMARDSRHREATESPRTSKRTLVAATLTVALLAMAAMAALVDRSAGSAQALSFVQYRPVAPVITRFRHSWPSPSSPVTTSPTSPVDTQTPTAPPATDPPTSQTVTTSPTSPVDTQTPTAPDTSQTTTSPATSTTTQITPPPTTTTAPAGPIHSATEQAVLDLVNAERAKVGCPALVANATLAQVARAHSQDMAAHNYFDHNGLDGSTPFTRMTAAGYRYSAAAENIAAGYATPQDVMTGWMNSAGHRANILNCGLTQIGVGYASLSSSAYGSYWTQDFGTPR